MKRLFCIAIAVLTVLPLTAIAAESTPRIDKRQHYQRHRIIDGVHDGSLTKHETLYLWGGQRHIQRLENRALSDGTVDPGERLRIERAQNRQSRRIFRQKHDAQRRW